MFALVFKKRFYFLELFTKHFHNITHLMHLLETNLDEDIKLLLAQRVLEQQFFVWIALKKLYLNYQLFIIITLNIK